MFPAGQDPGGVGEAAAAGELDFLQLGPVLLCVVEQPEGDGAAGRPGDGGHVPHHAAARHRPTWWNCARVPGRSRRRAGSPRRSRRRPSPRAPATRHAPGDTPTRDSRGPDGAPGRGSSARSAADPGAGAGAGGACRRATASRCQRSTVSGRTTRCSRLSTCLGSRCSSAASNARSPVVNRTLSGPSCRCRTESWWRSARISASLSRLLTGSSRRSANTFVIPR